MGEKSRFSSTPNEHNQSPEPGEELDYPRLAGKPTKPSCSPNRVAVLPVVRLGWMSLEWSPSTGFFLSESMSAMFTAGMVSDGLFLLLVRKNSASIFSLDCLDPLV